MMKYLFLLFGLFLSFNAAAFSAGTYTYSYTTAWGNGSFSAADPLAACAGIMLTQPITTYYPASSVLSSSGDGSSFLCTVQSANFPGLTGTVQYIIPARLSGAVVSFGFVASAVQSAASGVPAATVDLTGLTSSLNSMNSTLTTVFNIPASADIAKSWMIGFGLPMILYLTSWGYGAVIRMFDKRV